MKLRTLLANFIITFTACLLWVMAPELAADSYYKEGYRNTFNPFPKAEGRGSGTWKIRYFGPVGIGIDLKRPGMTMEINNIEEGSPADKTGKLEKGQIIESINGVVLKDTDPRIILGDIITEAEATDGKINLQIKGKGNVVVEIPVMGSYSDTWPVNCEKSDKIVRNLADLIAKQDEPSWGSALFLLSTGEEKDLAVVRRWMGNIDKVGGITWEIGYRGFGVCEYYLRTGDESVFPAIKQSLQDLKDRMYIGGWSGRGAPASFTYSTGSGQVHASGMYAMNFVLLAKLCGVDVDDYLFNESFKQFYRFAGHGNTPYGNGSPEGGFRDNGKTSGLAIAMAVAAQISPEGEGSVYAQARDNSAKKAFYATNWFHAAHTGGGMGEIWHHGAMALVREKHPVSYRSYHDTRRWVMDLSRRWDGSIAIEGMDDRYNRSLTDASGGRDWGTFFALTYTYPRKHLQIWGAPRSPYAKTSPLPARPWGNAADDIFQSTRPINVDGTLPKPVALLDTHNLPKFASTDIPIAPSTVDTAPGWQPPQAEPASPVRGVKIEEASLQEKMKAILEGRAEEPADPPSPPEESAAERDPPEAAAAASEPVVEPIASEVVVEAVPAPVPQPVTTPSVPRSVSQTMAFSSGAASFEPVQIQGSTQLTMEDIKNERVGTHCSIAFLDLLRNPDTTEAEMYSKAILHPEYGLRVAAMREVVNRGWDHLVVPLLKAEDPRLREAALLTLTGMFKGRSFPDSAITDEMFDLVGQIVENPDESWWVALHAVKALGRADTDRIAKHRDRLMEMLEIDSPFVQQEVVLTLTKIATEREHYQEVLPVIIEKAAAFRMDESSRKTLPAISDAIKNASSQIKEFAAPQLKKVYAEVPQPLADPGTGAIFGRGTKVIRSRIGNIVENVPGGEEFVRRIPKMTIAAYVSGNDSDMYTFSGDLNNNPELIGTWHWAVWPNPSGPDDVDEKIESWLKKNNKGGKVSLSGSKDKLQLLEDGTVKSSNYYRHGYFWSDGMLISNPGGIAHTLEKKSVDGFDFLLVEKTGKMVPSKDDDGLEEVPKDYHPGYSVYIHDKHLSE